MPARQRGSRAAPAARGQKRGRSIYHTHSVLSQVTSPEAHKQPSRDSLLKHLPGGQARNKPLEKQGGGEEGQISLDVWGANPGRARTLSPMAAFHPPLAQAGLLRAPRSRVGGL